MLQFGGDGQHFGKQLLLLQVSLFIDGLQAAIQSGQRRMARSVNLAFMEHVGPAWALVALRPWMVAEAGPLVKFDFLNSPHPDVDHPELRAAHGLTISSGSNPNRRQSAFATPDPQPKVSFIATQR